MGKASREKGKRGERELAKIFRSHGYDARRGVQYAGGPDSPDVVGLDGIHVEAKRVERLNLYDALEQAKGDSSPDEYPVVFHRKNGKEWVVVQPLEDWMQFYGAAENVYRHARTTPEQSLRGFLESM